MINSSVWRVYITKTKTGCRTGATLEQNYENHTCLHCRFGSKDENNVSFFLSFFFTFPHSIQQLRLFISYKTAHQFLKTVRIAVKGTVNKNINLKYVESFSKSDFTLITKVIFRNNNI